MSPAQIHPAPTPPATLAWRALAAWAALLAILLLPVLHAIHLATDDDGDVVVVVPAAHVAATGHPLTLPPVHDEGRCAVCFTFHAIFVAGASLAIAFAFLFFAPPARRVARYLAPMIDRAARPLLSIPRGPPAFAVA